MRHVARQSKILPRRLPQRTAFTLVELLVVMGVLAMMSSLVLVGLASAAEQARVSRTRSQVQKIHELLMTRWEDYRYRRVEALESTDLGTYTASQKVLLRQRYRVDRIRELIRMELPCHKEDLTFGSTIKPPGDLPALYLRYQRSIAKRAKDTDGTWADAVDTSDDDGWSTTHEGAECLYMILESIQDGETNGLDFFKSSEIGDTDGDGIPEILDGWGRPILFLRWAPGFVGVRSNLHRNDAPDPFDPLNVRGGKTPGPTTNTFAHFPLYPLVMSAGADEVFAVATRFDDQADMDATVNSSTAPNNPYYANSSGDQLGREIDTNGNGLPDDEYLDNISNHQLVIGGNDP